MTVTKSDPSTVSKFDKKQLVRRVFSGFALGFVAIASDFYNPAFVLFCLVVATLGYFELFRMVNDKKQVKRLTFFSIVLLLVSVFITHNLSMMLGLLTVLLLGTTFFLLLLGFKGKKQSLILTASVFYIAVPINLLVWLRQDNELGLYMILYIFFTTWFSDSFAYFVGKAFGKRKLSPTLSPSKTWEGLFGSCLGSVVGGLLVLGFLNFMRPDWQNLAIAYYGLFDYHWGIFVIVSFVLGIVGQIGDLLESGVKRYYNVKDSGSIIPGHGGVLDRIDALLLVAVCVAIIQSFSIIFLGVPIDLQLSPELAQ